MIRWRRGFAGWHAASSLTAPLVVGHSMLEWVLAQRLQWSIVMAGVELSDPIRLRLPVNILADIEKIAATSDRTLSWVMLRAMRLYLAGEGAEILNVAAGLEQLDHGLSEDMDDVIAGIERSIRD